MIIAILSSYDGIPESIDLFNSEQSADAYLAGRLELDRFLEPIDPADMPYWEDGFGNPYDPTDITADYWTDGKVEIRWMDAVGVHFPFPS